MNGKGMLRDGRYIGCTSRISGYENSRVPEGQWKRIHFDWQARGDHQAFRTVATCSSGALSELGEDIKWIHIPELDGFLTDPANDPFSTGLLRVNDSGGGLCPNTIDLFVGEGIEGLTSYNHLMEWRGYPEKWVAVFRVRAEKLP